MNSTVHTTDRDQPIYSSTSAYFIDGIDQQKIPIYLSNTNTLFEQQMKETSSTTTTTMTNINELRMSALLMDRIGRIQLETKLWFKYRETKQINGIFIWPELLKKNFQSYVPSSAVDQQIIKFIDQQLKLLNQLEEHCQSKLNEQTLNVYGFKTTWKTRIDYFLQQQQQQILYNEIEYQLSMIDHDFEEQRLKYEINQYNNDIEHLFQLKAELELNKQKIILFERYQIKKQYPKLLNSIQLTLPDCIRLIQNQQQRKQLTEQHQIIIDKYKADMFILLINIVQISLNEKQILFDNSMKQFWEQQPPSKYHSTMLELMEQRFQLIKQKIEKSYRHRYIDVFE